MASSIRTTRKKARAFGGKKMRRTIVDILVTGRDMKEVRDEVSVWMYEEGLIVMDKRDDFFKGRLGVPGGLLTSPKYFEASLKPDKKGVLVHTEGWIGGLGLRESSFSKNPFLARITRKKGWKVMEKLWNKLRAMSK